MQKVPITFTVQGGSGTIKVGDAGFADLEPYKRVRRDDDADRHRLLDGSGRSGLRRQGHASTGRRVHAGLGRDIDLKGHNALQSTFVFDA